MSLLFFLPPSRSPVRLLGCFRVPGSHLESQLLLDARPHGDGLSRFGLCSEQRLTQRSELVIDLGLLQTATVSGQALVQRNGITLERWWWANPGSVRHLPATND